MKETNLHYERTVASLNLLSLPYPDQKSYFETFVDVPFEVLDTYHNVMLQLPKLIEENKLSNLAIASLLRLSNLINFFSSNPELKNLEEQQFSEAPEWNKIREMARQTLEIMNEPITDPDKKYI